MPVRTLPSRVDLPIDAHELDLLLHSISVDNTVIGLTQEGGPETKVLIREVQMHPFKPQVLHVDFLQLHAGERLKVRIPVRLSGTPVGVHVGGGVMDQVMYDLEVECLPDEIPEAIDIDVSNLDIGESIRVADLQVEKARLIADGELPIVSVLAPTVSQAEEEAAAAADVPEPEVIRGKPQEGEE